MAIDLRTPDTVEPHVSPHTQTGGPPRALARRERPDVPLQIGRYTTLGVIGSGGMGVVYAAQDEQLGRKVAIKLLHAEVKRDKNHRLLREARALARLAHPNVVAVHEVGETGGRVYIVMEFIEGRTLRAWLAERKPSRAELLAILEQAGRGVAAAHAAGLIHRDLKPDNILVGDDGRVRVMDFGLARAAADESDAAITVASTHGLLPVDVTVSGAVLGTPGYMAPEQYRGSQIDARSDVFGFCVVLCEALYGQRPFRGADLAEIREATQRGWTPPPGADVPSWLAAIVRRGLMPDRRDRWANLPELLAALARDPQLARRRVLRTASLVGLACALVLGVTVGLVVLQQRWASQRAESQATARLDALSAAIVRAELRGDPDSAEALFQAFVSDPAHRGTRALARAWMQRGDRRRRDPDAALAAYAEAYIQAQDPADIGAALRAMSEVFHETWQGPALARALATLRARDPEAPVSDLAVDAALWRRDLAGAADELARPDAPRAAWAPTLHALAFGRATGVEAGHVVPVADPRVRFLVPHPGQQAGALLADDLSVVDRWRADGRTRALVRGSSLAFVHDGAEAQLVDLLAPLHALWRGPSSVGIHRAVQLDLDRDGAPEVVFSRKYPDRGLRALRGLGGADAREEVAHPGTDRAGSDIEAMQVADLDGDGAPELAVSAGPWQAFDLRILRPGPDGALELAARRRLGRVSALAVVRRGDRPLLAAFKDDHCPEPELFPEPPHVGVPAGMYLFQWTGSALEDAGFVPLALARGVARFTVDDATAVGDFDGDGRQDLAVALGPELPFTWLLRQTDSGFEPLYLAGLLPLAAAQLDDDPADELLVGVGRERELWALGAGEQQLPPLGPDTSPRAVEPLGDPLLLERWTRAEDLASVGLPRSAAASLQETAGLTADLHDQIRLLDRAAELWSAAGDDEAVLAVDRRVERDVALAPHALARTSTALLRLGRYEEALRAANSLAYHLDRTADEAALARSVIERVGPLVEPSNHLDLHFDDPLPPAWEVLRPGALQRDPTRSVLRLPTVGSGRPLARLDLDWEAGPLALEIELDVHRLEYGACLAVAVEDTAGTPWLGLAYCAGAGGGRILRSDECLTGGTGWIRGSETEVPSALTPASLRMRALYDPERGAGECLVVVGDEVRRSRTRDAAAPRPGRYRLTIGAVAGPRESGLGLGDLRRVDLRGARLAPVDDAAARRDLPLALLVEGEPAAALDALRGAPAGDADDLVRLVAHDDLGDPAGLGRAVQAVLPHLSDPAWLDDLVWILRERPAAAAALRSAAGPALLPLLAAAWQITGAELKDPALAADVLRALRGVDLLLPQTTEQRDALRRLLALRAAVWAGGGEAERARRDLEAALALDPTDHAEGSGDLHLRLARLLVDGDPSAARAHAERALHLSPTPELVRELLRDNPRWRTLLPE